MPRFFVSAGQINQSHAVLAGPEFHHLRHVLRLNIGDSLTLCDEHGREHRGTIISLSPTNAEISLTASSRSDAGGFSLTLAQGLLKGRKMDLVVEKTTELGVQRVVPFFSVFTIAQLPEERRAERVARWQRLAHSAAKQSGSPVPQISPPQSFTDFLAAIPAGVGKVLLYEQERRLTLKAFAHAHPTFSSLCVVVGPEGGFAAEEVEQARVAGFHIAGLGTRILRAETAGIVAVALCRFLWGEAEIPPLL